MNSRTIQAALMFIGLVVLGMFLAQWIVTLPEFYQIFTICVFVLLVLLLLIKPKVGLDVKFLFFICLGYAFGGKGFAYISPFEPFYVSEVCLLLCLLGFLLRAPKGWEFFQVKNAGLLLLFIFLSYSALRLALIDFPRYGILSIRDCALAYYALFMYIVIMACQKEENFFALKKLFLWMGPLALLGTLCNITGVTYKLGQVSPYFARMFEPHADIASPLLAASATTAFLKGVSEKKLFFLAYALIAIVALALSKTAAVFCLVVLFGSLIIFTGRQELLIASFGGGVLLIMIFLFSALLGFNIMEENEHLETFGDIVELDASAASLMDNTTSWRLGWWRIIAEDTFRYAPFSGVGWGGDISTHFFEEMLGIKINIDLNQAYGVVVSRYPHNVFFTVLGRLGIPGVIFFTFLIQLRHFKRMIFVMRKFFTVRHIDYGFFMITCFALAGIANSFVQMTYEGPYAAIPHWSALGFMYAYIQRIRKGMRVV